MTYFVVIATYQGESDEGVLINWNFKREPTSSTEPEEYEYDDDDDDDEWE